MLQCARSSSSNYHNVGIRSAALSIRDAVRRACKAEGLSLRDIDVAVLGLAAMDCPKDFLAGRRIAAAAKVGRHQIVKHDSTIALHGATLGKPGIVVNAGTGSFAVGMNRRGKIVRAGGRGPIIDDEGSAYDIGRLAIRAALRSIDGREGETALTRLLMREFRLRELEDIVHDIYRGPITVEELSALSRLVERAALDGDRVARRIFAHEGLILAGLAVTVARRLRMTNANPNVYCVGGVFNAGNMLLNSFKHELRKTVPKFTLCRPTFEPVVGAFALALRESGEPIDKHILANLTNSCAYLFHVRQRRSRPGQHPTL